MRCAKKSKFPYRFISQKSDKNLGFVSVACSGFEESAIDDNHKISGFFCSHDDRITIPSL
ncbi:MAG: hypothetical protein QXG00_03390 [Candidatus Woesearchaeota archaeon]